MNRSLAILAIVPLLFGHVGAAHAKCAADAVAVGPVCVDKFEASLWRLPPSNSRLKTKVVEGRVTLADLEAGGAVQLSRGADFDYDCDDPAPATFPVDGNWEEPLYAVSVAGVRPAGCMSWFQAEQACRLSGKRLLTNQEWQAAAAGTPDPRFGEDDDGVTQCNIIARDQIIATGTRSACVSKWGAFDMVGNVWEWVADWVPRSTACPGWEAGFTRSEVLMCLAGADTNAGPGALMRGGSAASHGTASVFAILAGFPPSNGGAAVHPVGFRCGR